MSGIGLAADSAADTGAASSPIEFAPSRRAWLPYAIGLLAAAGLGQLTALSKLLAVWSSGAFFDTDDAMRSVQVRDLMAGQGWFDMSQYRLDPPAGVFMHWSRIVDLPLLVLIKTFGAMFEPAVAERLARLAFPLLLTILFFALMVFLCERLLGPAVRFEALAAAFLYGPATGQFEPGRIDHHAPQIVLLVAAIGGVCASLQQSRGRPAVLAGIAVAVSMAVSVENVPFFVALFAVIVLVWVLSGEKAAPLLTGFAAGLCGALPCAYLATIAPSRWLLAFSDALSLAQAVAMLASGGSLVGLAVSTPVLRRATTRAGVAAVAIAGATAVVAHAFPLLFENPFTHLDPVVRLFWLDVVDEAQPLIRKLLTDPFWTIGVLSPILIGLVGTAWQVRVQRGQARLAWLILLVVAAGGFVASLLMVRTLSAVLALCVPGALALALRLRDCIPQRFATLRGPFGTLVLILATGSVGWAAACNGLREAVPNGSGGAAAASLGSRANFQACATPAAFSQLARLPVGLVLTDPDLGGYVLAHTPHSVLAGAYHRNERGLREAIDIFMAPPSQARSMLHDQHIDYVVLCRAAAEPLEAQLAPGGLAASLRESESPLTLRHGDADAEPLDIYQVE